jgi:hypothetical protein
VSQSLEGVGQSSAAKFFDFFVFFFMSNFRHFLFLFRATWEECRVVCKRLVVVFTGGEGSWRSVKRRETA